MADAAFHFAAGLLAGTGLAAPGLFRAWRRKTGLSAAFGRWLVLSYGLGVYALVPSLLRRLGTPGVLCDGWWSNVFLFYSWLNRIERGGMLVGGAFIVLCFAAQYALLLLALAATPARRPARTGPEAEDG